MEVVGVFTAKVTEDLKKKAGVKFEAKLKPKLLFWKISERKNCITINVSLRWRVEDIKAGYFATPTVEFRLEGYEASRMPRKIERLEGLLPPARLAAHGDGFLQRRKQSGALYSTYFVSLDKYFFL